MEGRVILYLHYILTRYIRTSSKKMAGMCFWGEHFTFTELPKKVEKISILIYKDRGIRRRRNPVGRVKICVSSIQSRREVSRITCWFMTQF